MSKRKKAKPEANGDLDRMPCDELAKEKKKRKKNSD